MATGNALNAKVRHEPVPVENGKKYTVAFWAKVDAGENQSREVTISVQMQQDPWPGFYNKNIVLDSTDWKEYTDTFVIEADAVTDVWVGLCVAQSDVDFWVDDFRFFEGEPWDEIKDSYQSVNFLNRLPISWGSIKISN